MLGSLRASKSLPRLTCGRFSLNSLKRQLRLPRPSATFALRVWEAEQHPDPPKAVVDSQFYNFFSQFPTCQVRVVRSPHRPSSPPACLFHVFIAVRSARCSEQRRASTGSSRSEWEAPDLNRELEIGVGGAGPQRREECHKICQKACQKRCQKICQKKFQKICHIFFSSTVFRSMCPGQICPSYT